MTRKLKQEYFVVGMHLHRHLAMIQLTTMALRLHCTSTCAKKRTQETMGAFVLLSYERIDGNHLAARHMKSK
jgi:hypothetical protein